MKAILVIDMPVTDIGKEFVYRRHNGKEWVDVGKYKFMPMPEPKDVEVNEIEDIMHTEYSIEVITNKCIATTRLATDKLIALGWNACLDEIGGQE